MALALGIPMGIYTALAPRRAVQGLHGHLAGRHLLPTFLIGILLILFFGVQLRWLPSFGRGDVVGLGWWTTGFLTKSGLLALIMPAITLALFQMTLIIRRARRHRARRLSPGDQASGRIICMTGGPATASAAWPTAAKW